MLMFRLPPCIVGCLFVRDYFYNFSMHFTEQHNHCLFYQQLKVMIVMNIRIFTK